MELKVVINARSGYLFNRPKLRQALEDEIKKWLDEGKYLVSVLVAGDRLMRNLEKRYFHQDKTTNVLSFPLNELKPGAEVKFPLKDGKGYYQLGEIIISYPQAKAEAALKGSLVEDEICLLGRHGLRHLLGINHN